MPREALPVSEAAKRAQVSEKQLRTWLRDGAVDYFVNTPDVDDGSYMTYGVLVYLDSLFRADGPLWKT